MEVSQSKASIRKLKPIVATADSFKEYGQVIEPSRDGEVFGPQDAQLDLSQGTPRFYVMRLEKRSVKFSTITHHARVTQCLGSIGGEAWYLGVARPSIVESGSGSKEAEKSRCGHFYVPPAVEEVRVFKFTGPKFVKLNTGTWHAGPLFEGDWMDFYNLELSDTNVVDHTTHSFKQQDGVTFLIEE